MKNNQLIWIVIGFVLIAVLLGLYLIGFRENQTFGNQECDSIVDETEQANCYNEVFRSNSDELVCETVTKEHLVYNCYKYLAININSPELCERTYQKNYCYSDVATTLKDESICDNVEGFVSYSGPDDNVLFRDYCLSLVRQTA